MSLSDDHSEAGPSRWSSSGASDTDNQLGLDGHNVVDLSQEEDEEEMLRDQEV
jgi:hypothetical protein